MKKVGMNEKILFSLYRGGYIGGQHTSVDDACKGFPKHERGAVKKAVNKLIKKGFLIKKNAGYGLHVSLNPRKREEIEEIIEKLNEQLNEF